MLDRALEKAGLSAEMSRPRHLLAFSLASCSILTLLFYFFGWLSMIAGAWLILLPSSALLSLLGLRASRRGDASLLTRLMAGVWAGSFATLAYDLVRMPLAHAGVPVFKAISYFGTVMLDQARPTLASEVAGWGYHFSNGVGFAIMYTLMLKRPGWLSAVMWGLSLEGAMLLTPYAEVFGYRRSTSFLAISVGGHIFYGVALWLAARFYLRRVGSRGLLSIREAGRWLLLAAWLAGPFGLLLMAADFHKLHADTIASSPPAYIGPDLYVTWNVPEADRIGAIWLMTRYVNPAARFHFIEPMSSVTYGTPFDLPEAQIRRHNGLSTFEVVLERAGRQDDPAMSSLAKFCHLMEVRPWAMSSAPAEKALADSLAARLGECRDLRICLDAGLSWFDEAHARLSPAP